MSTPKTNPQYPPPTILRFPNSMSRRFDYKKPSPTPQQVEALIERYAKFLRNHRRRPLLHLPRSHAARQGAGRPSACTPTADSRWNIVRCSLSINRGFGIVRRRYGTGDRQVDCQGRSPDFRRVRVPSSSMLMSSARGPAHMVSHQAVSFDGNTPRRPSSSSIGSRFVSLLAATLPQCACS